MYDEAKKLAKTKVKQIKRLEPMLKRTERKKTLNWVVTKQNSWKKQKTEKGTETNVKRKGK